MSIYLKKGYAELRYRPSLKQSAYPHLVLMNLIDDAPVEVVRIPAWTLRFCTCSECLAGIPLIDRAGEVVYVSPGIGGKKGPQGAQ
jgi:hypothetical protein